MYRENVETNIENLYRNNTNNNVAIYNNIESKQNQCFVVAK